MSSSTSSGSPPPSRPAQPSSPDGGGSVPMSISPARPRVPQPGLPPATAAPAPLPPPPGGHLSEWVSSPSARSAQPGQPPASSSAAPAPLPPAATGHQSASAGSAAQPQAATGPPVTTTSATPSTAPPPPHQTTAPPAATAPGRACPHCGASTTSGRGHQAQTCSFRVDWDWMQRSNIHPTILRPPKHREFTHDCLKDLSLYQRTHLAWLQDWAVPGVFPFCFLGQYRSSTQGSPPALKHYTCHRQPATANNLRRYLEDALVGEKLLPKHIVIIDEERQTSLYLGPDLLRPPASLLVRETATHFVVEGRTPVTQPSAAHAAMSLRSTPIPPGRDGLGMYQSAFSVIFTIHTTTASKASRFAKISQSLRRPLVE